MTSDDIEQALNDAFKAVMPRIQGDLEISEGAVTSRPLQGEPDVTGREAEVRKPFNPAVTSPDISAQPAPRKAAAQ